MHWFAIVFSALHHLFAGARDVPAHGMLEPELDLFSALDGGR